MWTINYRGLYIHGYCGSCVGGVYYVANPDECCVTTASGCGLGVFKSSHAAKCAVTKHLNACSGLM